MRSLDSEQFGPTTHRAVVRHWLPLEYEVTPPALLDIGGYVRAASAVGLWGDRLVVVQDDVNGIAVKHGARVIALPLPANAEGERSFDVTRGNKHRKMDLEASVVLPDGRLLAFGSGSTPARERIVTVAPDGTVNVCDGASLYRAMRGEAAFAGAELNVEGAIVVGACLRFFQRGNGAVGGDRKPVNATADVALPAFLAWLDAGAAVPKLQDIRAYDLGAVGGVAWTFTDATVLPDGTVIFVGAAEASPNTYLDGETIGSCVGVLKGAETTVIPVVNEAGELVPLKLEGIEHRPGTRGSFYVVADMDDPASPALLGQLDLERVSEPAIHDEDRG